MLTTQSTIKVKKGTASEEEEDQRFEILLKTCALKKAVHRRSTRNLIDLEHFCKVVLQNKMAKSRPSAVVQTKGSLTKC